MSWMRFFLPRLEYILLAAIFWGIAAGGPRMLNFDGDLPRHILTGELILQTGQVHTTDVFSFRTEGHASYPHEWLSQVLFALAHRGMGLDGIVLMTALVVTITWGMVYRLAIRRSGGFLMPLAVTALGAAAGQMHVLPRPHIFTYLMIVVWITLLEAIRESRPGRWWVLPVAMLLWVNLHGMFVLGILILGMYVVGGLLSGHAGGQGRQRDRSLMAAGALSLAATLVSPSGPAIWKAIAALGSNVYITSKISEYQTASFHQPETWPFLLLLLLTLLGLARGTTRLHWVDSLLLLAFSALALYSSRMIPIFAVAVAPVAAAAVSRWLKGEYPHSRLWIREQNLSRINAGSSGAVWIVALVLWATLLLRSGGTIDPASRGNSFDRRFFPVAAVSWLEAHPPQGRMFNEFDWGGYLLLKLWPRQSIFMDGHTHIYGERLTREYEQVIAVRPGWEQVLDRYEISWVIVRRSAPLARALLARPAWQIAYEDSTAIILSRSPGP